MAGIEIIAVADKGALKEFIDLPWRIYAAYPKWVPPLKKEVGRLLDPRSHPFWEFSERILFLARLSLRCMVAELAEAWLLSLPKY